MLRRMSGGGLIVAAKPRGRAAAKGRTVDADAPARPAKKPRSKPVARTRVKQAASRTRAKAADKAAAKAKDVGATGVFKTRELKAIRDAAIVARHVARTPHRLIAAEFGVSVRTVEDVVAEFRRAPSPLERLPMSIVEDYARTLERAVAEFEAMAARQETINSSVSLGARKAAQDARRDFLTLLAGLGKLPDNLEVFRMESELARLGQLVIDALDAVADGRVAAAEARDHVKELVARRELPVIETSAR